MRRKDYSGSKRGLALLLAVVMTLSLLPGAAFAAGEDQVELIKPGLAVTASSEDVSGGSVKENAIDGDPAASQWSSADMKTNQTTESDTQTPQWLTVDLGTEHTYPVAIDSIKLWYNMKVWPMVYEIQTTDDVNGTWDTIVRVERSPFNGAVKNGAGQDIADETGNAVPSTAANTDTITKTSSPALAEDAAVQRYVRVYIEKVNTLAPGNNTGLREIQIYAPAPEEPIEGAWNLAEGQPAAASDCDGASTADKAVDGNTADSQWSSGLMKSGGENADPNADQTPQWLWVDLGYTGSQINQIKLWYNVKVWPMVYEIQTTDDDPTGGTVNWETVVRVERSPASDGNSSGWVENGAGQNIADHAANTDTITTTSSPSLQKTTLKRYVRFYAIKVNTKAGGDNTGLREFQIFGVNENRYPAVDVNAVLALATSSNVTVSGSAVSLPDAPSGATLTVAGSSLENVVANDGTIGGKNIGAREVKLLVRAWDNQNPDNYQQKNLTVTVPDHKSAYPAAWFPSVSGANAKPEVIPAIQEWYGYKGSFTLSASSRIVINDAAGVGLQKAAQNMKADVKEISGIDLPIVTGTSGGANDIYIESQTADSYDLGKEGYLMRVSDEGVKIYAPTYTGCIFGTITVEQILWQAADHLSVPKGIMRDYPAYEVRGLKLDIGRAPTRYQQLQDYAKIMLWYKMSEYDLHINDTENVNASNAAEAGDLIGFHRLESSTFPSLKLMDGVKRAGVDPNLVDAAYYNDSNGYGGNPVYTKQQWKDLTQLTKDYGMHLLTEIDMPGHALAYNNYVEAYPAEAAAAGVNGPIRSTNTGNYKAIELLDLKGANAENALNFAKALWDEYTSDGTITGNVVHIGADEYWDHDAETNNKFSLFADELRKVIQKNLGSNTKIRMWGATSSSFAPATTVLNKTNKELAEDYELEIWSTGYDDPLQRSKDGYKIVNCEQSAMYSCPGRHQRDVPNAEYVFNSWDPTVFGGSHLLYGDPNLLGAKAVMWGEQTQEGLTERDVHQRVLRAIAIVSEKTWTGTQQSEGTFSDYEMRFNRLAEGPGTQIAMKVDSETSLVLDYDFKNLSANGKTVFDQSGNGYNGTLNAAGRVDEEGWLTFNGSTLLTTDIKTLSYPYTVSFDLKVGAGNTAASSLFSGYDGRIQVAGHNGKLSANNCSFIRDFDYTVPTGGAAVNITLVGTFQATRLYVNGELVTFLSQTGNSFQDGVVSGAITSYFSSVPLPLEKIGQNFKGQMANLKVYNKALSAAEVAAVYDGTDDGLVNVAQNAVAGGSSYQSGDGYDGTGNANQRTGVAQKAVDGEEEEMYSFWRADHSDSALTVDLGQIRTVSKVETRWDGTAPSSTIQTSTNGTAWNNFTDGAAVNARYVKVNANGAGNLQELLVYEQVNKTDLADMLEQAEALVEDAGANFESTGEDAALFDAVVFARAVKNSPLATKADVAKAMEGLAPYADEPEPSGFTVTVPDDDITLIAARANWTEVEGAAGYTVTITSEEHAGLGDDNVWYQDNDARTVKLANLHPGVEYTVTVSGGGETASATFTTKIATNAKAEAAKLDPEAPASYGALPDDQQLYYHENDMASFIHFGPNTFNNKEWGTGSESPSDFNLAPGELTNDPAYGDRQIPLYVDQWVKELQDAGFKRLIMVAKHHDGFCLWDTQYTEHNVMHSPYGRDLLWDVSAACTKYNMDMGFYFSPWDMHDSSYGQGAAYNEYYINQLREVLGNPKYGNNGVFVETWMDGAKGSGAHQEYDFDSYFKVIKELQPECLIYTDRADGGVRWSGNEAGSTGAAADASGAGDMCWQTMDVATQNYEGTLTPGMMVPWKPGGNEAKKWLRQRGQENGVIWAVCECDVSIENGWFGKSGNSVHSLEALLDMYLSSVGYGSPLLLNLPPVTTGYFREASSIRLAELGKAVRDTFRTDMLREEGYTVTASANKTRASATAGKFGAANLIDGDPDTYWTMDDGETTGTVTISLGETRTFDVVTLKEYIPLGQRIKAGTVEYHDEDGWHEFSTFTTIGAKRIMRSYPVKGDQIRVSITGSNAVPLLSAVEVYKARSGMELGSGIPDGVVYVDDQAEDEIQYSASGWNKTTGEKECIEQTKTHAKSQTGAASFTYTFTGSKMYVMGIKDTSNGRFRVKMDDGEWTEVNTADTVFRQTKTILWASDDLTVGEHTISVEWVSGWFDFDGLCYVPSGKTIVEFEKSSYNVFPNGEVELKLVRSGDTSIPAIFKVVDLPNTAVQGQHYVPLTEEITMGAGVTEATIRVQVLEGTSGNPAMGKDFSVAITDCRDPNTTIIGFADEAAINIVDPDTVPQEPKGETYTEQDPFNFPTAVGKTRKLEAEHMVLDGSEAASGKHVRIQTDSSASGGKKVGWFEPNNKVLLHYNAPVAGEYTVTMCYQSGRDSSNPNHFNWRGDKVVDSAGTSVVGANSSGNTYETMNMTLTVSEAGAGTLEFYADASAGPNMDYFTFRLDVPVSDKSALQAAYDAAREVENEDYTDASWSAFQNAIAAAQAVLDRPATQAEVDKAVADLAAATEALIKQEKPVMVTVTFQSEGAAAVTVEVEQGTALGEKMPANPTRTGYTFGGWFVGGTAFTKDTVVSADTTVAAKWTKSETPGGNDTPSTPSSSSSSVDSRPTTTTVETREDGTEVVVVTKPDGTVIETVEKPDGTVEAVATREDGTVTVTVTDPEGKTVEKMTTPDQDMTITVTDPQGEVVAEVKLPAETAEPETKFVDVPEGHWAEKSINKMAGLGVVNGVGEDHYGLMTPMTRGSVATVLYRLSNGKNVDFELEFADVDKDGWYADGVSWAARNGVVKGIEGVNQKLFWPNDVISREQLAVMLTRYAKLLGMSTKTKDMQLDLFADGGNTSSWAVDGVAWCVEKGILQGKGGSVLDPRAEVSRAEAAIMLERFLDLLK